MDNLYVIVIVGLILGLAVGYIVKARARGAKCIGCPDSGACSSGGCGCCGGCPSGKKE